MNTDQKHAEGINYRGVSYLYADGTQVHEVDSGEEFKSVRSDADTMKMQLQQADDTAIELYETHLAQADVASGVITAEQYLELIGEEYPAVTE